MRSESETEMASGPGSAEAGGCGLVAGLAPPAPPQTEALILQLFGVLPEPQTHGWGCSCPRAVALTHKHTQRRYWCTRNPPLKSPRKHAQIHPSPTDTEPTPRQPHSVRADPWGFGAQVGS